MRSHLSSASQASGVRGCISNSYAFLSSRNPPAAKTTMIYLKVPRWCKLRGQSFCHQRMLVNPRAIQQPMLLKHTPLLPLSKRKHAEVSRKPCCWTLSHLRSIFLNQVGAQSTQPKCTPQTEQIHNHPIFPNSPSMPACLTST